MTFRMKSAPATAAVALLVALATAAAQAGEPKAEETKGMTDVAKTQSAPVGVPAHLPPRMAICSWIWSWVTFARPEEPYGDLEKCVAGLKERGFNAIRVDAGLNWCFTLDGNPRGEMEFGPWAPGVSSNLSTVNQKGGARHDVLKRLVRLMELAKQYDIYVILTSWEYQDSTWMVVDPKIRAEVYGIPEKDRLMALARQHDQLLRILKQKGLDKHVAFVEVHNEIEYSDFPKGQEGKALHRAAIAFLRAAHPDVLISADYGSHDPAIVPDNGQGYDQHMYSGAAMYFGNLYNATVMGPAFDKADPRKNPILARILKKDIMPWDEAMKRMGAVRPFWHPIIWLYDNIDNAKFDAYMLESLPKLMPQIKAEAERQFEGDAREAARRRLPAVLDEGGYFYPPVGARWEQSAEGLAYFEFMAGLAIKHGYWGFMPTTYCGPEHPLWVEKAEWLRTINTRFRNGK